MKCHNIESNMTVPRIPACIDFYRYLLLVTAILAAG